MIGSFGFLSEYNLLNSTYKLKDILTDVKKFKYPFLAINDTNNLYATYKVFKNATTPYIIGMKLDIVHLNKECSILLYVLDDQGYTNLNIISSMVQLNENKRLEFSEVIKFQKGIYFISSGFESDIDQMINSKNLTEANKRIENYKTNLEFFALGLTLQSFEQEIVVAPKLKELASKYDLLLLPVNYMAHKKEDVEIYNAITQIHNKDKVDSDIDFSFLTTKELKERYLDYLEVFSNLKKIISLFKFKYKKPKFNLPQVPGIKNSKKYLKDLANKGLLKYLKENNIKDERKYFKRLNLELNVIDSLGYNDYFLVVWDFVRFAKNKNILVGPGRGSAAGSLVSFTLSITDVDPLKYGLLFERFLNKARKSMPDIDLDFPDDKREDVIDYIIKRYGTNRVVSINTFSRFSARSSIRDICRIKGYTPTETDDIVKTLTKQQANLSPNLKEIKRLAEGFHGLPRQTGTHAAGIILAAEDLRYNLPLQQGPKIYQSQFEHEDLEDMGLLKIDLLGIRNLSIIKRVTEIIKEQLNKTINLNKLPFNDKKTYELLSSGDTRGIFQLESVGMRNVLRKLKPRDFNDLVALLALYRPGPMQNIDVYIKRRNGQKFSYIDNSIKDILKETYGIIVYQEQIILIAEKFAGYTLSEADLLRVGVSKKDKNVLEKERIKFIERSVRNNHSKALAEKIYNYIVKFADYGFNKSHSVAYGMVSYQMAYLKANYYDVFMAVLMSKMVSDAAIFENINDLRKKGIKVLPPNINRSTDEYLVTNKGIMFPLSGIKSIGSKTVEKIITERNNNGVFENYANFKNRLKDILTERVIDNLIFSGALNTFKMTKKGLYEEKELSIGLYEDIVGDLIKQEYEEYETPYLAEKEKEALGFNLSINPSKEIVKYEKSHNLTSIKDLQFNKKNEVIVGAIKRINEITTKTDKKMAFLTITDYLSEADITVFPEQYKNYEKLFKVNNKVVLRIRSQNYKGGSWILVKAKAMTI